MEGPHNERFEPYLRDGKWARGWVLLGSNRVPLGRDQSKCKWILDTAAQVLQLGRLKQKDSFPSSSLSSSFPVNLLPREMSQRVNSSSFLTVTVSASSSPCFGGWWWLIRVNLFTDRWHVFNDNRNAFSFSHHHHPPTICRTQTDWLLAINNPIRVGGVSWEQTSERVESRINSFVWSEAMAVSHSQAAAVDGGK